MTQVVGYNEFKDKMRMYIVNLAKDIRDNKKTEQTIYVLLGPPGIGKSFISEKLAEAMERPLINVDLGGRKDTGILEGVSPSVKAAYPGRPCQGISVGKNRGAIILLDEFEKVADEGLAMMIANYADQVPDFVQNRAEMVNIELATYQQRVGYVKFMLGKKLRSDKDTEHYAEQLTDDFCKYIITEDEDINRPIDNFTQFTNLETSKNRFIFTYEGGQKISLVRIRTMNKDNQYKEAKDWIKETKFPEYNCKIGWNANNEILLVTQNYFGGQRLKQEKEQELLGKIRKKIHQELNNIDRELKTGERSPQYSHEERENIKEYQEELKEGLSTKNYEELNEFSFTHLFNEELQQLGNIKEGGNNTSYDLSRSDIAIL
ncbi:16305_t:CDS:2 [Racocetra persica]|uniref:16305_t:CDS:1 n=1 Tax=Racocetra persica TaxID=160502 RepID=A0ACA9PG34_9GLOM|nr:16305_t:CDS:2 [Racocetra persica]